MGPGVGVQWPGPLLGARSARRRVRCLEASQVGLGQAGGALALHSTPAQPAAYVLHWQQEATLKGAIMMRGSVVSYQSQLHLLSVDLPEEPSPLAHFTFVMAASPRVHLVQPPPGPCLGPGTRVDHDPVISPAPSNHRDWPGSPCGVSLVNNFPDLPLQYDDERQSNACCEQQESDK
jgi:hypothetical protein